MPILKKIIIFILLIGVFLGVATLYRELRLNQITQNAIENYLRLQNEIQNYLNIAENRNNIAKGNNSTLNQIYNKYSDKKLLALLILDDNKNIIKMITRQSISKRTLETIKPSLNHEKKIVIKEKDKLCFINFSLIKSDRGENLHFNLIFRLESYLTTRSKFKESFNFYTPIALIIFIILLTIIIFKNQFSFKLNRFKFKKLDIFTTKKKTTSTQPPITSDTNNSLPLEPIQDTNKTPPSPIHTLLIKQFILADYSLLVSPLYTPDLPTDRHKGLKNQTNKVRSYNQIWELNEFHLNKFTNHPLCQSVINNLTATISLNDFIKSCFADFLHHFPDFLYFYFSAKNGDSYSINHFSPTSLAIDKIKNQKFVPVIGKEKKYFQTYAPYIQTISNPNHHELDHSMLCFPLITPKGFKKALVKIIVPNNSLAENKNLFHRWNALFGLGVEHFQNFPENKTALTGWLNRRYFIHLLKTCNLNLADIIFEVKENQDIQQKIIKINVQKKVAPTAINENTLKTLKKLLDQQFNQYFIFALQKETTTIWAASRPSKISNIDKLVLKDLEQGLSNTIKDNLCHILAIKKGDLRITIKNTPIPKHLKGWNLLEKNKLFWKSSR